MQKRFDYVLNDRGEPVQGATVTITTYPAAATATIYSDDGVTTQTNPITTGVDGLFEYYAADGRYTWTISGDGFDDKTIQDIFHLSTDGAGSISTNTAVPESALAANTTGTSNTAFGKSALALNTTGVQNTGIGANSLAGNTTGTGNTASGNGSLVVSNGDYNTANGNAALAGNTDGDYNCAYGVNSLLVNTTGTNNTCLGYNSGNDAVVTLTTQSNYVVLGNNDTANANIKVAWTVTSDARDKTCFAEVPHGLDFVYRLKPVAFRFKTSREDETPTGPVRYGFKAQDVLGLETDPVIINADDQENLKYNESSMIPVLVKAIQELKAEFDAYREAHP